MANTERVNQLWRNYNESNIFAPLNPYDTASSIFLRENLQEIYSRIFTLIFPDTIEPTFIEIGGNFRLALNRAVSSLQETCMNPQCTLIAHDLIYKIEDAAQVALSGVTKKRPDPTEALAGCPSDVRCYTLAEGDIRCFASERPFPDIYIPEETEDMHLFLLHVINYFDKNDLENFLTDPRIKTLTISNTADRGCDESEKKEESFLHDNRVETSEELKILLKGLGYMPIYIGREINNGQKWTDSHTAVYVRTGDDRELENLVNERYMEAISDWHNETQVSPNTTHSWIIR